MELIKKLPIKIEIKWVRGHQNENKHGEIIHGPFIQEIQMNILVDELANRSMQENGRRENI